MILIEFLKQHKNALLMGLGVSTCLLSLAFLLLANLDLLLLMGFITLLTPPGFAFALLGMLLLGTMIGASLWTGFNDLVDEINAQRTRSTSALTMPLIEADPQTTSLLNQIPVPLEGDREQNQWMVHTTHEDTQLDAPLSPEEELTAFSKAANRLLIQLSTMLSSPEALKALSECFGAFKKLYYRLAKKYHPDKGVPDKVVWSTHQFQQLNAIYSQAKMSVDHKLENLSQKSLEELLDEEHQLLEALIGLLKEHLKWLKQAEVDLKAIQLLLDNLDKEMAQNEADIRLMDEGIARNAEGIVRNEQGIVQNAQRIVQNEQGIAQNAQGIDRNAQGITRNAQGIAQNEQIIAENDALLKKNAQSMADLDALIARTDKGQKVIWGIMKELAQEGKYTLPPNNLDTLLSSTSVDSVDKEASKNKTPAPTFFK